MDSMTRVAGSGPMNGMTDTDPFTFRDRLVRAWQLLEQQSSALSTVIASTTEEPEDPMPLFAAFNATLAALRGMRDAVDSCADEINRVTISGLMDMAVEMLGAEVKR